MEPLIEKLGKYCVHLFFVIQGKINTNPHSMPGKVFFNSLILVFICTLQALGQQKPDTSGCSKLVNYRYDRFTEEKKIWTNGGIIVDNSLGEPDYPMAAKVYRIRFFNTLSGKLLETFEPAIIISDELLKQPINEKEITIYFIFEGDNKFNIKSNIINNGYENKLALPLEGNLLNCYKSKKLKALRITGLRGTSVDFDLNNKQSEQLVNELVCMFSYKQ